MVGVSFKDIDKAMKAAIDERQPTKEEEEMLELIKLSPEKIDPDIVLPPVGRKPKGNLYSVYSLEETMDLINAGKRPVEHVVNDHVEEYSTYSREEVEAFMEQHFSKKKGT